MSAGKKHTSEKVVSSHENNWVDLGSAETKDYAALAKAAEQGDLISLSKAYKYNQHSLEILGVVGLLFAIISDINLSLANMKTSMSMEDGPKFLSCDALVKGIQGDIESRSNEGNKLTEITLKLVLLFNKMHELSHPSDALSLAGAVKGDEKDVGATGSLKSQTNGVSTTSSSSSALVSNISNKESQLIAKKGGQSKEDNKKEKPVSQHESTDCSEELEDDWVDVGDVVKEDGYAALRRAANAGNVELFVKLWRQSCQDPPVSESKETGVKGLISIVNQMLDLIKPIYDQTSERAGALSEKRPVLVSGKIDTATIKEYFGALNEMESYLTKPRLKKIPEKNLIKIMTDLTTIIEKIKETGSVLVRKERHEKENGKAPSSHRPGQNRNSFVGKPPDSKEQGFDNEPMKELATLRKEFDKIVGGWEKGSSPDPDAFDKCQESVDDLMEDLKQLQQRAEKSLSTGPLRTFTFAADALADSITVWKEKLLKSLGLASVSFSRSQPTN